MENRVTSLREALDVIRDNPKQYVETDVEADPYLEITGAYRKIGAGGTVKRPTRLNGPAMMFNNIKGYPGARIAIGVLGSRARMGLFLDTPPDQLAFKLKDSINNPIPPVYVEGEKALCQQVVHRADDPDFDIRKILPVVQTSDEDPAPCITLGVCRAQDPETGESDITMHRMFVMDMKDEISILAIPTLRHIGKMIDKAEKMNIPLPISVSIGLDPAIYMSTSFVPPTTPYGFDELSISGALRGEAVELAKCLTVDAAGIANSEYVIEGEVIPGARVREDKLTDSGNGLAEFAGYTGGANSVYVIKVKAITHRIDPIYQTCIGPSEEHVIMAGIPLEACILNETGKSLPGIVKNVYSHSSGGGKFMAIMQIKKSTPKHEGMQRQAALIALTTSIELKHVILVDDDVDIFDSSDVLWALNTRYQGDIDTVFIPSIRAHVADPSAWPYFSPFSPVGGVACKAFFDCTVPFEQWKHFVRPGFDDVDVRKFLPDYDLL
ncbi:MAG: UbiD family decarboxylase [Coriobacteriia bacterium]|nr:UbiD family decarboxylase [Coriobacteriia bacterium]